MRWYNVFTTERIPSDEQGKAKTNIEAHMVYARDESHAKILAFARHPKAHLAQVARGYGKR